MSKSGAWEPKWQSQVTWVGNGGAGVGQNLAAGYSACGLSHCEVQYYFLSNFSRNLMIQKDWSLHNILGSAYSCFELHLFPFNSLLPFSHCCPYPLSCWHLWNLIHLLMPNESPTFPKPRLPGPSGISPCILCPCICTISSTLTKLSLDYLLCGWIFLSLQSDHELRGSDN